MEHAGRQSYVQLYQTCQSHWQVKKKQTLLIPSIFFSNKNTSLRQTHYFFIPFLQNWTSGSLVHELQKGWRETLKWIMKFTAKKKIHKVQLHSSSIGFLIEQTGLGHCYHFIACVLFLHCAIFITAVLEAENNWIPTESDRRLYGKWEFTIFYKTVQNFCITSSTSSFHFFVCLFHVSSDIIIYFKLLSFFPLTDCHLSPPISANIQKDFDHFKMEKYSSSIHPCFPP